MAIEAPRSPPDAASLLLHGTNLPLFLPFFLGFSASAPRPDQTGSGSGSQPWPDRFVFIDPSARSLDVVGTAGPGGARGAEGGRPRRRGRRSRPCRAWRWRKAASGSAPFVWRASRPGSRRRRCRAGTGSTGGCIERWLGIHGTCPVCRYEMLVEEGEAGEKRGGGAWVSFAFGVGGGDGDDRVSSSSSSS